MFLLCTDFVYTILAKCSLLNVKQQKCGIQSNLSFNRTAKIWSLEFYYAGFISRDQSLQIVAVYTLCISSISVYHENLFLPRIGGKKYINWSSSCVFIGRLNLVQSDLCHYFLRWLHDIQEIYRNNLYVFCWLF